MNLLTTGVSNDTTQHRYQTVASSFDSFPKILDLWQLASRKFTKYVFHREDLRRICLKLQVEGIYYIEYNDLLANHGVLAANLE